MKVSIKQITLMKPEQFSDFVDTLSNEQRIELREGLRAVNHEYSLLRALHFNYITQEWI